MINATASGARSFFMPPSEPRAVVLVRRFVIVTGVAYAVLFS